MGLPWMLTCLQPTMTTSWKVGKTPGLLYPTPLQLPRAQSEDGAGGERRWERRQRPGAWGGSTHTPPECAGPSA